MNKELAPSGEAIFRYEERKEDFTVASEVDEAIKVISDHVEQYIGKIDGVYHEILSDLVHVDIIIVKPTKEKNYYTLVTCGMSNLPMTVPEGAENFKFAELVICLPSDWKMSDEALKQDENYWPILWLKKLARFPHEYGTWLYHAHTIPNGDPAEPFATNTALSGMILGIPATVDNVNDFFTLEISNDKSIHFFSLIPIYTKEMDFKLKKGADALAEKLEQSGVNELVDLKRKSVCKNSFWIF
ncbi:suppressor of fused domain protein [Paenibacillus sp. CMAA1364]